MGNEDASDAFHALHSEKAIKQLKLMKPVERKEPVPPARKIDVDFRKFKEELRSAGFFERDMYNELFVLVPIVATLAVGTYLSYSWPLVSIALLGVGLTEAGWLGHDMIHARNSGWCDTMKHFV